MTLESRIDRVIEALGRYYGAISRDAFTSLLVNSDQRDLLGPLEAPPLGPASAAASALLNVTDGGYTTPDLIEQINEMAGGDSDQAGSVGNLIKICFNGTDSGSANVILTEENRPRINGLSQGKVRGADSFSIRSVAGISSSGGGSDEGTGAGETSAAVIQVFGDRLTPANRGMGAVTLFMNAIPTLEISRAVPFIDVVLIQEGGAFDSQGRIGNLSLGQFLMGNVTVPDGSTARTITGATDAVVKREEADTFERTNQEGQVEASPISTAGMELFTSPQTMVNADEDHYEIDEITDSSSESNEASTSRQAPIIDKFRPLMTLKSLTFSVVPSGGMMSYKSGKMTLTLHDRSRLAEVSAFVRPAKFGTTHLLIEYGWSHPNHPVHASSAATDPTNLYGEFIGSLRSKEKYQIVNSTFSFDDTGQVEIELILSMLSSRAARQVHIGLGIENSTEFKQVKELTDMIQEIRQRLDSSTAAAITGEADILGSLTEPSSVLTLDDETIRQIQRVITVSRRRGQENASLQQLGNHLRNLVGTRQSGETRRGGNLSARGRLRTSIETLINQKVREIRQGADPFFVGVEGLGIRESDPRYTSLGKILSTFALGPIVASGYYRDVQLIFYNFNSRASFMANRNIASFPVEIDDFGEVLRDELDQLVNMPIESFSNFMNTYFVGDPGAKAYGFSGLYEGRDNDQSRQLENRYRVPGENRTVNLTEDTAALNDVQQTILRNAYTGISDSGSETLEFRMPTLQMVMETVPIRAREGAELEATADQTALRIHIFDSQSTSHATVQSLLEAASTRSVGLLNRTAQAALAAINRPESERPDMDFEPEMRSDDLNQQLQAAEAAGLLEPWPPTESRTSSEADNVRPTSQRYRLKGGFAALKQFIMRTMPSMRYGEGSSGIISARVQSMSDPSLTTVNMLRQSQSPDSPAGTRRQGLPLQVAPVECSLETIGCPLWNFGQQVFLDFGTGTTIDGIYGVTGIDHTLGQGEFKSSVKLTPMSSYARYTSLFNVLEEALTAIEGLEEESEDQSTTPST